MRDDCTMLKAAVGRSDQINSSVVVGDERSMDESDPIGSPWRSGVI